MAKIVKSVSILLFGISCVGKTTVGKLLSQKLGWRFFDVDDGIVKRCGCPIGEFVENYTCVERNDVRRSLILEYLDECFGNKVIAISPMHFKSSFEDIIAREDVIAVYLKDKPTNIFKRIIFTDDNDQPMDDSEEYKQLHKAYYLREIREDIKFFDKIYRIIPNVCDIDGRTAEEVAEEIVKILEKKTLNARLNAPKARLQLHPRRFLPRHPPRSQKSHNP